MSLQLVIAAMEQLIELHEELISVGHNKKQAIIDNDISALSRTLAQETRLLKKVSEAEERRIEGLNGFLREKGIRSQLKLNITEMTRLVFDPEEKQRLISVQERLSKVLHTLKELNSVNKELVEQSLAFIDYSLNLLVEKPEDNMLYQHPVKQRNDSPSRSFFDTRA
ncbi:flagellar protein FlgN [Paenibacillus terreus]|uniref:Flagellar protein FlgN n=1 Tax=Paenibacillus terreus TaxID=1387834 RepID=A0ABV5B9I9_9BACL